jgi:hypothetical protein
MCGSSYPNDHAGAISVRRDVPIMLCHLARGNPVLPWEACWNHLLIEVFHGSLA